MENKEHKRIVNFIWNIADDCLRDVYVRSKYRDVILPMTVIRRLDAVLEYTRKANTHINTFENTSPFLLKDLDTNKDENKLKDDFLKYLNGFTSNVKEILSKFQFELQVNIMAEAGILGIVIEKFTSPLINLSPRKIKNAKGKILPALDNHGMGTVFESLIRQFSEENNEEAGEHYTPRDVVKLMADLIFEPIMDTIQDNMVYTCYDGACGTGGMLTIAENRFKELASKKGKKGVQLELYGQESQPETYAIANADLLLKGDGEQAKNIQYGSTLSKDAFSNAKFTFMLSNPPYGKSWRNDSEKLKTKVGRKKMIIDPRFRINLKENKNIVNMEPNELINNTLDLTPRLSDGQLLFLLNNVSKMEDETDLGSRIVEVHNGSALFTGDAGQGESNCRYYLFDKDYVEAIIALPEKLFYNTGIDSYLWILSNRKLGTEREGMVQLIDATSFKKPREKNLGNKSNDLEKEIREKIVNLYLENKDSRYSKKISSKEFGYYKLKICHPQMDENGVPLKDLTGNLVEDKNLSEFEQIPLTYPGGIEAFLSKEIKRSDPHAWIDDSKIKIGYEVSFKKYFYDSIEIRELDDIISDFKNIMDEIKNLSVELLGD